MFTLGGGFNCLIGQGHKNGEGNISVGCHILKVQQDETDSIHIQCTIFIGL